MVAYNPTISVVIPAFNSEEFIGEALDSVLSQTLQPTEIIVVDDGSTDNTKDVVLRCGRQVKYIYQDNAGSGKARNTGIKHSTGDLIAFLDSDDVWRCNHLERLVGKVQTSPHAQMVYGAQRWVTKDGSPTKVRYNQSRYPEGWIFADLFEANYIATPAVLVKKSILFEVGGFNESEVFRNAQDYDLWLRISAKYYILSEPEVVIDYRRHDNNRTLDHPKRIIGHLAALKNAAAMIKAGAVRPENHPEKINLKQRMTRAYSEAVASLFWISAYEDVRRIGLEAIRENCVSTNLLARFILSLFPAGIINILRETRRSLKGVMQQAKPGVH